MKLNQISDNAGARKPRKRVGRGTGSGTGTTAGRGMKGQKSRSGVAIKGFEGGQMPIYMRLPKRGFNKPNRKQLQYVNIGKLDSAVSAGKLDAGAPVTEAVLVATGIVRRRRDGIRLLAKGDLKAKLNIEVTGASKAAIAAVEKAGGSVTVTTPAAAS